MSRNVGGIDCADDDEYPATEGGNGECLTNKLQHGS
jgi:hypothetical protein